MTGYYLETGSIGWRHRGWNDSYYPDGLPQDWRFEFYTHLFRVVAIPSRDWMSATTEDMTQWLEDGGDEFSFLLMIDDDDWQAEKLMQVGALLSERLLGIVVMQDQLKWHDPVRIELSERFKVFIDSDPADAVAEATVCWRPGRTTENLTVGILTAKQSENTRQMREYIESFLQQAGKDKALYLLFSGDPPGIKAMQDAEVIGQMLTEI